MADASWRSRRLEWVMATLTPEEMRARVAARIREIARLKGIRMTELPALAGVSRAHLWDVLSGKASPSLDFLTRVANGLGVDPSDLVKKPRRPAP